MLGRELNLFTEKKEVGKPGAFDHMADEELIEFIDAQGEIVRELELLPPPAPKRARVLSSIRNVPVRANAARSGTERQLEQETKQRA